MNLKVKENIIGNESKKWINILILFLSLFSFGFVVNIIAYHFQNPLLRLWKEVLIFILFFISVLSLFINKNQNKNRIYILIFFTGFLFIFYFSLNLLNNSFFSIIYQFKQDIVPILLPISLYFLLRNNLDYYYFCKMFFKMIIIVSLINAIVVIFQSYNTDIFLGILGISDLYNTDGEDGIRIISTEGGIRAIGLTTSFSAVAALLFLSIILLIEDKSIYIKARYFLIFLMVFSLYKTTYKTAILALFFYIIFKVCTYFIRSLEKNKLLFFSYSIILFLLFFYIFTFRNFYNFFSNSLYENILYNSVYLRVYFHDQLISQILDNGNLLGAGFGVNGVGGLNESKTGLPLDSMFANILSNYGFFGILFYISIFFSLFILLINKKNNLSFIACILIFYIISFDFMANAFLYTYPFNIYAFIIIMMALLYKENLSSDKIKK